MRKGRRLKEMFVLQLVFSLEQSKLTSEVLSFFFCAASLPCFGTMGGTTFIRNLVTCQRISAHLVQLHPPPAISTLFPLERKKFSLVGNKESEVRNCTRGCCWQTLKVYSCRGTSRILGKCACFCSQLEITYVLMLIRDLSYSVTIIQQQGLGQNLNLLKISVIVLNTPDSNFLYSLVLTKICHSWSFPRAYFMCVLSRPVMSSSLQPYSLLHPQYLQGIVSGPKNSYEGKISLYCKCNVDAMNTLKMFLDSTS